MFAMDNDPDYRAMYSQAAQNAVKECVGAWKSFFALKKAGDADAKIPRYKKKEHASVTFSNQGCRIENGMLRLPGTKIRFDVGSFPHCKDKLIEVRIVPYFGHYQIHILTDDLAEEPEKKDPCEPRNAMMIDLGVDNFATITDSIGRTPIAVKGGYLKSINQNWNRMNARLKSILMKGHDPKTYHPENTKLMNAISARRDRIFRDMFYKISHFICTTAVSRSIDMIIVGRNTGWKQNANMGHRNNQTFVQIPYAQFICLLKVTVAKYGIEVFEQDESYTSKASFIDDDPVPTYGNPESPYINLSGRRTKRGLYRTADGTLINADVNGSLNIGRKYDQWMFENMPSGERKRYASSTAVVGYRTLHPESKGR
jgi:putative transposase